MLETGQNNPLRKLYPLHEGSGAPTRWAASATPPLATTSSPSNYQAGDAPVSYPYLWNIWKFDWVQYNGSVSQPLARNVGEALGVGAIAPLRSDMLEALPHGERYRSSVDIAGLTRIEHALQLLQPPRWPEEMLGRDRSRQGGARRGAVQTAMPGLPRPARRGRGARSRRVPLSSLAGLEWRIEVIPLEHIGTDPTATRGFMERRYDLSATGLSDAQLRDALRPLLTRNLMRDVRFRLKEVVRLRTARAAPPGDLPTALAEYPDPDRDPKPTVDLSAFAAIDSALGIAAPLPAVPDAANQPPDPPHCDESTVTS